MRERAAFVKGKASIREWPWGGHPGDPMHFESPPNSAPWFGTPNEGLLGSQACLSVSDLLAFATVLRDRLF